MKCGLINDGMYIWYKIAKKDIKNDISFSAKCGHDFTHIYVRKDEFLLLDIQNYKLSDNIKYMPTFNITNNYTKELHNYIPKDGDLINDGKYRYINGQLIHRKTNKILKFSKSNPFVTIKNVKL
jgi:hypothetical protein